MNEDLDTNNKNKGIQSDGKLPASDYNSQKSDKNLNSAVGEYNKILEKRKQNENFFGNLFATIVCILIFLAVVLNIYMVETEKYEQNILKIQQEQIAKQKQEELDKVKLQIAAKNRQSADLVIFNDKYFGNLIIYCDTTNLKKINSLVNLKTIKENNYKVFHGIITSKNKVPVKFLDCK